MIHVSDVTLHLNSLSNYFVHHSYFSFLYIFCFRMIVNTLSNLLIFNFEAVEWDFNLEPERPEGLGNLNIYAKTPPRRLARSHVRAHKLMRADTKDSLPSRPPSRAKSPAAFDQIAALVPPNSLPLRISSAPPRIKHQESTINSMNAHVQRILNAHKEQKTRPQSSPVVSSHRSRGFAEYDVPPTDIDSDLRASMIITQVTRSPPVKPSAFPDNRRSQVITRSRSAPAYRTQVLPPGKRGWTTSAAEPLKAPENKIMVTAQQAREKIAKMRPHSAHVQSTKESISLNPVKSLSCLNLKTYTTQLQFEQNLQQSSSRDKLRRVTSNGTHRPKSCIPCVR